MSIGTSEERRNLAISLLETDPGFIDLLPHFVSFIVEGVRLNVNEHNMVNLIYLMRMVHALAQNDHLNIEHYLHDLMPSIFTCTFTKTLHKKTNNNHWALRDFSAKLIGIICRKCVNSYNNHHIQVILKLCIVCVVEPTFNNNFILFIFRSLSSVCTAHLSILRFPG